MRPRVLCPFHEERTPSCLLYENGFYCFGCGKSGTLTELGYAENYELPPLPPEDLAKSFKYISNLPWQEVRGLSLPADKDSFYIVWPELDYYKRRFLDDRKTKYLGAAGHKKPWFWVRRKGEALVMVEGELNALSIAEACPDLAVVSPGGAGDFSPKQARKHLQSIVPYSTILIVADADAPGAQAIINLYGELAGRVLTVKTLLMPIDANDILVSSGKEALREEIKRGMRGGLETGSPVGDLSSQGLQDQQEDM